jgi:hypothetical protein
MLEWLLRSVYQWPTEQKRLSFCGAPRILRRSNATVKTPWHKPKRFVTNCDGGSKTKQFHHKADFLVRPFSIPTPRPRGAIRTSRTTIKLQYSITLRGRIRGRGRRRKSLVSIGRPRRRSTRRLDQYRQISLIFSGATTVHTPKGWRRCKMVFRRFRPRGTLFLRG